MDFHSKLWTKTASTDELVALSMGFLFSLITKDRIETTAGSWALQGSVVPRDAYIVHKSRKAGALLLAKAGMSEWAEIRKMDYSQGYAAFGGQGRSAIISLYTLVEAAQALRLRCNTDIRQSTWWERWERTVRDATHVLDAIYGIDRRNNYTLVKKGKTPGEGGYSQFLTDKSALKGAAFGIPWNSYWGLEIPLKSLSFWSSSI
ncbi:amidase [Coccidioides immitis RS]|uniref:Amidase n=1 Tax=Coccidioides immitis (strain RS) TaxID=246410 RepID=A0A0E1S0M5_COCIM|nr:amidase [Coccidioides immitis RS]EAS36638.2 amidase [Coccidioides immitis RS]TPX25277.1 hypothetical protein DIZ76_010728 [Coccidioides immitis]